MNMCNEYRRRTKRLWLPCSMLILAALGARADSLQPSGQTALQRLKLKGVMQDGKLIVYQVKQRNPNRDANRMKIKGQISAMTQGVPLLEIGPYDFVISSTTVFKDIALADLEIGGWVEVDAQIEPGKPFHVLRITPDDAGDDKEIELIGSVLTVRRGGSAVQQSVGGITVDIPPHLYANGIIRRRRLDDKRPQDQWTAFFLDRPVTIGGELGSSSKGSDGESLDGDGSEIALEQEAKVEFFYPVNHSISVFLEGQLEYESVYDFDDRRGEADNRFKRGEAWLYWSGILGSRFSLQVGSQNINEDREWWWDADLDAIRVFYDRWPVSFEIAVAEELFKRDFSRSHLKPGKKDIARALGHVTWKAASDHQLEFFFLKQWDHSSTHAVGKRVEEDFEDEIDANLFWRGLRLSGKWATPLTDAFEPKYWIDVAQVTGRATTIDYQEEGPSTSRVSSVETLDVDAWAFDMGTSLTLPLSGEPTFTLSWARGSGDRNGQDSQDNGFRQTSLEDNNGRYNGIDRFRYYGELLRPDLSNINIFTGAFGLRMFSDSSIELLFHDYHQVETSFSSPDIRVDSDYNGDSRHIGRELDFVVGLEEWTHWELEFVASYFSPGRALEGNKTARGFGSKINFNF